MKIQMKMGDDLVRETTMKEIMSKGVHDKHPIIAALKSLPEEISNITITIPKQSNKEYAEALEDLLLVMDKSPAEMDFELNNNEEAGNKIVN